MAPFIRTFAPENAALLKRRDDLQARIDDWHRHTPGTGFDAARYKAFSSKSAICAPNGTISPSTRPMSIRKSH